MRAAVPESRRHAARSSGRSTPAARNSSSRPRTQSSVRTASRVRMQIVQRSIAKTRTLGSINALHQRRRSRRSTLAMPVTVALTRSRSAAVRYGFQTSRMRIARGTSLSFQASCSIVSSNTQASPGRHSRVSRADAEAASRRDDERHVHDDTRVGDAGVRGDVRLRIEDREESRRRVAGNVEQRQARKQLRGARAASQVLVHRLAVAPQVENAPAARVIQLGPLIERHALRIRDVRLETRGVLGEHALELFANIRGRGLELIEPGELRARIELARRQLREIQESRLGREDAAPAEERVDAMVEALLLRAGMTARAIPATARSDKHRAPHRSPWLQRPPSRSTRATRPERSCPAEWSAAHCGTPWRPRVAFLAIPATSLFAAVRTGGAAPRRARAR